MSGYGLFDTGDDPHAKFKGWIDGERSPLPNTRHYSHCFTTYEQTNRREDYYPETYSPPKPIESNYQRMRREMRNGDFAKVFSDVYYNGEIANDGYPAGKGKLKNYINNSIVFGSFKSVHRGNQVAILRHGHCRHEYDNGSVLEGMFVEGKANGVMTGRNKDGAIYRGDYVDGIPHGNWEERYSDGVVYRGKYKNGKYSGPARVINPDGSVFDGRFVEGEANGPCKKTYPSGAVYEGSYGNGKRHGQGVLWSKKGTRMDGNWVNGGFYGYGKYATHDALVEGEFKNSDLNYGTAFYNPGARAVKSYKGTFTGEFIEHGKGKFIFDDADKMKARLSEEEINQRLKIEDGNEDLFCSIYEGDVLEGSITGKGVKSYGDGVEYKGEFLKGQLHGVGVLCFPSGEVYDGEFENSFFIKGKLSRPDGYWYCGKLNENKKAYGLGEEYLPSTDTIYKGQFKSGERTGKGVLTKADGTQMVGRFSNGEFKCGKIAYANGLTYKVDHRTFAEKTKERVIIVAKAIGVMAIMVVAALIDHSMK